MRPNAKIMILVLGLVLTLSFCTGAFDGPASPETPTPGLNLPTLYPKETVTPTSTPLLAATHTPTPTTTPSPTPAFYRVYVQGNAGWVVTEIFIEAGDYVSLVVYGQVCVSAVTEIAPKVCEFSPQGLETLTLARSLDYSKPAYALLGKIGKDTTVFVVGQGLVFISEDTDYLVLGVNDDEFSDNTGEFVIEVTVTKP